MLRSLSAAANFMTLSSTTTLSKNAYQNSKRRQCFNSDSMLKASNAKKTAHE